MFFQLKNISFTFAGKNHLLNNVSLVLDEKKIYALMGVNGSGKTTLFNLITGFLRPQSGNIVFKEQTITGLPPYRINRVGIGRTFQDLRLISKLTVRENVLLAMQHNPTDDWTKAILPSSFFRKELKHLESKAEHILTCYFLQEVQHSLAHEISFGQQKLLNLACCIANGAELLLLDEPVAGISPTYRKLMTVLIQNLKEQGKTILMIEHNTDFIAETADHFLFLTDGRVFKYESFVELKTSKVAASVYFQ